MINSNWRRQRKEQSWNSVQIADRENVSKCILYTAVTTTYGYCCNCFADSWGQLRERARDIKRYCVSFFNCPFSSVRRGFAFLLVFSFYTSMQFSPSFFFSSLKLSVFRLTWEGRRDAVFDGFSFVVINASSDSISFFDLCCQSCPNFDSKMLRKEAKLHSTDDVFRTKQCMSHSFWTFSWLLSLGMFLGVK
jgi:hypothetical protein